MRAVAPARSCNERDTVEGSPRRAQWGDHVRPARTAPYLTTHCNGLYVNTQRRPGPSPCGAVPCIYSCDSHRSVGGYRATTGANSASKWREHTVLRHNRRAARCWATDATVRPHRRVTRTACTHRTSPRRGDATRSSSITSGSSGVIDDTQQSRRNGRVRWTRPTPRRSSAHCPYVISRGRTPSWRARISDTERRLHGDPGIHHTLGSPPADVSCG